MRKSPTQAFAADYLKNLEGLMNLHMTKQPAGKIYRTEDDVRHVEKQIAYSQGAAQVIKNFITYSGFSNETRNEIGTALLEGNIHPQLPGSEL